jgi:hypothetical protein
MVREAANFIGQIVEAAEPSLSEEHDFKGLNKEDMQYEALILARRGQGQFRRAVEILCRRGGQGDTVSV